MSSKNRGLKILKGSLIITLTFILMGFFVGSVAAEAEPSQIVLTWQNAPMTTMTITWRTDVNEDSYLYFAEEPDYNLENFKENPADYEQVAAENYSFAQTNAWLHRVELTDLEPGARYPVVVETAGNKSEAFYFKTAPEPEAEEEVVLLLGNDIHFHDPPFLDYTKVNKLAAEKNPDAILWAGDLVESPVSESEWDILFDQVHKYLITENNRRIPIIPAIGNHDTEGYYDRETKDAAPYYYGRFNLPGEEKYYALQYGPVAIMTLDSHTTLADDVGQLRWLNQSLEEYSDSPWIIAQHHLPGVVFNEPTTRCNEIGLIIQNRWWPLYRRGEVDLVLTGHWHSAFKTVPLSEENVDLGLSEEEENAFIEISPNPWSKDSASASDPDKVWWLEDSGVGIRFFKLTATNEEMHIEPVYLLEEEDRIEMDPFTLNK